jgi:hypothetical protein
MVDVQGMREVQTRWIERSLHTVSHMGICCLRHFKHSTAQVALDSIQTGPWRWSLTKATILGWPASCCSRGSATLATTASDTCAITVAVVADLPAVVVFDGRLLEVGEVAALDGAG